MQSRPRKTASQHQRQRREQHSYYHIYFDGSDRTLAWTLTEGTLCARILLLNTQIFFSMLDVDPFSHVPPLRAV